MRNRTSAYGLIIPCPHLRCVKVGLICIITHGVGHLVLLILVQGNARAHTRDKWTVETPVFRVYITETNFLPTLGVYRQNDKSMNSSNMTRKLLTALVLLLIGIGQAQSQTVTLTETYFPDAKFRAYISSITGVAEGGTLSEEKLKSVTYIDVSGYYSANGGITSLKGVEYFTALETLICYDNQLSSLDVSQNIALTTLYCYDNQLTSLDVSQNTALTSLSCFGNQLTSLDVSGATALTSLSCGSNQLMSLDVSQNTALTDLSCYGNQLTSLDVSHNTALTRLYCSSNQLMSLDLSKCTKLTYISFLFQSKSVIASSLGSNQYIIDVPADFDLSKVTSFKVNSVSAAASKTKRPKRKT